MKIETMNSLLDAIKTGHPECAEAEGKLIYENTFPGGVHYIGVEFQLSDKKTTVMAWKTPRRAIELFAHSVMAC